MVEFNKKVLKNGLTVLHEGRAGNVVSMAIAMKYGYGYESEGKKGISHFIEHMIFKGTKKRNQRQIAEGIEKKGGDLNGFTEEQLTAYYCKMPKEHFQIGIDILSDICFNPLFPESEFEKERQVILEEMKMYHDDPRRYVLEKTKEFLYKKPFAVSGVGTVKSLKSLKRQDLIELHDSVYSTNNMVLCVVGDVGFKEVCDVSGMFPSTKSKIPKTRIVKSGYRQVIEKRKGIDQANLVFSYHAPTMQDKKIYAQQILSTIMAGGMSSRLFHEIRNKRGLAYAVKGFLEVNKDYGYDMIYIGTVKEKIKEVKELIVKEFRKIKGMEKREMDETKERLIGLKEVETEESRNTMTSLLFSENAGDANEYYKSIERINAVKLEDVKKLARLKGYSFVALVPA